MARLECMLGLRPQVQLQSAEQSFLTPSCLFARAACPPGPLAARSGRSGSPARTTARSYKTPFCLFPFRWIPTPPPGPAEPGIVDLWHAAESCQRLAEQMQIRQKRAGQLRGAWPRATRGGRVSAEFGFEEHTVEYDFVKSCLSHC